MGPRTEPWGTPEVTGMLSQEEPSTTTCWEHTLRKSSIQFRFLTRILYLLRLQTPQKLLGFNRTEDRFWPDFADIKHDHIYTGVLPVLLIFYQTMSEDR